MEDVERMSEKGLQRARMERRKPRLVPDERREQPGCVADPPDHDTIFPAGHDLITVLAADEVRLRGSNHVNVMPLLDQRSREVVNVVRIAAIAEGRIESRDHAE